MLAAASAGARSIECSLSGGCGRCRLATSGGGDGAGRRAACARRQRLLFVLGQARAIERDARVVAAEARDDRLQFRLDVPLAVAIEQMTQQAAVEIGRTEEPVGNRER